MALRAEEQINKIAWAWQCQLPIYTQQCPSLSLVKVVDEDVILGKCLHQRSRCLFPVLRNVGVRETEYGIASVLNHILPMQKVGKRIW